MLKAFARLVSAALIGACLFAPQALALPGQSLEAGQQWLLTHAVIPGDHFFVLPDAYGSYLGLNKGQELVLTAHYNLEPLINAPRKVLYERLSVYRSKEQAMRPCREAIGQGAGATGYLFPLADESLNAVLPGCQRLTEVNFLDRSAPMTIEALSKAYGSKSPLLADFRNASVVGEGHQYLTLDWDEAAFARTYTQIRPTPILARVYSGQTYDYLLTRNTLTVVYKGDPGYWNDWEALAEVWDQHKALWAELYSDKAPNAKTAVR